jgi:hypothetical protein
MAGRPPIYSSADELEAKVEDYFALEPLQNQTITGLALWLGFESRQSLYDYEKVDQFSYIVKRARLRIEHAYEVKLNSSSCTGAIFALKNMGWKDKTEQEVKMDGGVNLNFRRV